MPTPILKSNLNPSSKLIQLVAYVPPAKFAPLSLESTGHRALLPDWGSFAILDGEVEDGVVIDASELIGSFVDDLDALFDVDNIAHARTIDNLRHGLVFDLFVFCLTFIYSILKDLKRFFSTY